jgi:DNA repair protein RecN (Recombination protein N)
MDSQLTPSSNDQRREEIARMLAGAEITAEARAAAERLIRAAS